MNRQQYILIGWREVRKFMNMDQRTLNSWVKHHAFPARHGPNGKIFCLVSEIIEWIIAYDNVLNKKKGKPTVKDELAQL